MSLRVCPKCGMCFVGGEEVCPFDRTPLTIQGASAKPTTPPPTTGPTPHVEPHVPTTDPGTVIADRYRITSELGRGTTGTVYLAQEVPDGDKVAVKVLNREFSDDEGGARRFLIEAKAAGRVTHPNIVSVLDYGCEPGGRYFIVMEYIEGRSLRDVIAREGPLDQVRVIDIIEQLLSAVSVAHEMSILHRDLKPDNVLCTNVQGEPDRIKVLDFGIAKILGESGDTALTRPGDVLGTPQYMSPEQVMGKTLDPRTDLYAIGIIMYEALTRHMPFKGSIAEVFHQQLNRVPPPPSEVRPNLEIHPDLERLVIELMAKDREVRVRSAPETLDRLARIRRTLDTSPRPPGREPTPAAGPSRATASSAEAAATPATKKDAPFRTESVRRASGILTELCRCVQLWEEKVAELVQLLWRGNDPPPELTQLLATIRTGERRVAGCETEITLLEYGLEVLADELRTAEEQYHEQRSDLLGQQSALRAVLDEAEGFEEDVRDTTPDVDDDLDDAPTVQSMSWQLVTTDLDLLERRIAGLDARFETQTRGPRQDMAEREEAVLTQLRRIIAEREALTRPYRTLPGLLGRQAMGRSGLGVHLAALARVAASIQVHETMLGELAAAVETPT